MAEQASKPELSFAEFSETLEKAAEHADDIVAFATLSPSHLPAHIQCFEQRIESLGIRTTVNGKHSNSHHVENLHNLLCHRELLEVKVNEDRFESWHEAAIKHVLELDQMLWWVFKMESRSQPVVDYAEHGESYLEAWSEWARPLEQWVSVKETVDWKKIIVELRRERRLMPLGNQIGNEDPRTKEVEGEDETPVHAKSEAVVPPVVRGVSLRSIAEVHEPDNAVLQEKTLKRLRKNSANLPHVGYAQKHSQTPLFAPEIAANYAHKKGLCDKPNDILSKLKQKLEDCGTD